MHSRHDDNLANNDLQPPDSQQDATQGPHRDDVNLLPDDRTINHHQPDSAPTYTQTDEYCLV